MCGLAGVFHLDGGAVDLESLRSCRDAMTHRGPDGEGLWLSDDRRVGLAHRRLSIVDLHHLADQPMANETGAVVVVFNGEIYNHHPLRGELAAKGHRFVTDHADTEVLVHGYEEWGIDGLLSRIEGMFAFALWDGNLRRLHLVRDRLGVKPLYLAHSGGALHFASEIKGLVAGGAVSPELDPVAMYHYLTFLATPAPMTMFAGVAKLPAATLATIDEKEGLAALRYWAPLPGAGINPEAVSGMSERQREAFYVVEIARRLDEAVEKRMMADVPFGAFLSGGVDSSAITALMSRHTDRKIATFSVGYEEGLEFDERAEAKRAAAILGTDHHEIVIGEQEMKGYLAELVHSQDEPLADWVCVPLHFVSKLTREAGVKVALVGEGADELFCGYEGFLSHFNAGRRLWPAMARLPKPVVLGLARIISLGAPLSRRCGSIAELLRRAAKDRGLFWGGAIALREGEKDRIAPAARFQAGPVDPLLSRLGLLPDRFRQTDSFNVVDYFDREASRFRPGADLLTRMTWLELAQRLPELLLMRVDKVTMATSLEARVPFLDHRLVELAMDIPGDAKVAGGVTKRLLKKAVADILPPEIVQRKKMGFGAPVSRWLKGPFGREVEQCILDSGLMERGLLETEGIKRLFAHHRKGREDAAVSLWTLYNLSAWYDRWID